MSSTPSPRRTRLRRIYRFVLVIVTFLLGTIIFLSGSSAHKIFRGGTVSVSAKAAKTTAKKAESKKRLTLESAGLITAPLFPVLSPPDPDPETIETFAADCVTPKTSFNFGDEACVKVSGGPPLSLYPRRIAWVDTDNNILRKIDITSDPQTDNFVLPATNTTTDYRGVWRVNAISSRASIRTSAFFGVSNPAAPSADLLIYNADDTNGAVTAGSNIQNVLWLKNNGPDNAELVSVSDPTPANTTFLSGFVNDPAWHCQLPAVGSADTAICRTPLLAPGASAKITLVYLVTGGTSPGTVISNTAHISSNTPDPRDDSNTPPDPLADPNADPSNNTATARTTVIGGAAGSTCTLNCPVNIVASANTEEGGQRGAHVSFGSAVSTGDCGTVTATPASGSFFPVGNTQVSFSSSDGDGSCSFIVTVEDNGTNPPTISCPANHEVNANNDCEASVVLGTPTTTGDNVTVVGTRSDGKAMYNCDVNGENCVRRPIDFPFSAGVTTVTWTAYSHDIAGPYANSDDEEAHRTGSSSCTQTITVNDVEPPTITGTPQTSAADASCQAAIPDFTATATVSDNCACSGSDNSESCQGRDPITITQSPAVGTLVGLGPHTITLTANDGSSNNNGAGNTATTTVVFTVVDSTGPTFTLVPAAVTAYTGSGGTTCDTTVDPGMATATDNCSAVTITRSPSGNTFPVGNTTITWTATDVAGNNSTATQIVTVVDNTPPTISCPSDITVYLPLNSTDTSMAVSYPAATANDNCPGTTIGYSIASGSVFPVGPTTVTATATDASGNTTSCSFTIKVLYDFTGFFSPISNTPTLNSVNAGKAIPIKFSLSGDKGLNIFAVGNPYTVSLNCNSSDPGVDVIETVNAGGSSLSFGGGQYIYTWKTENTWAGTCRQLVVTLNDGTVHVANFKFR